jgi:integrase
MRVATGLADAGEPGAVAAMMALLMGMRASEIVRCVGRDIDDRGRLLWIPLSKTPAGKRTLQIPAVLRGHLIGLADSQDPHVRLFAHDRAWVRAWVRRICWRARVPVVCAHSMRGLHATLAIEVGMTSKAVANALGHRSFRETVVSYADQLAVSRAVQRRALAALGIRAPRSRGKVRGKIPAGRTTRRTGGNKTTTGSGGSGGAEGDRTPGL